MVIVSLLLILLNKAFIFLTYPSSTVTLIKLGLLDLVIIHSYTIISQLDLNILISSHRFSIST
jgi:hypothetical protein